ncbi:pseudouridine-5'-phosphate glycosidase [Frankia sp. AgB1.9]|uniref:pseudouridine-5'-phosphate glycosidase n=1 Tax=unclassified Frankia TaxID=2632575 RepID=UPI001934A90A|nr:MULTISPECIES: pseudouridine-5'-phosphate glycosidase [unclassified Frankia]MBL7494346.1 pseudouridine-5'-phosphate glycosidase [Frankia sp. AgW1.1]MBL7553684.1 pseudouridine-5'-phosphate glycosidase [Frankia sp. AgB1.9]MBL7617727.1 pseudouridine-5'-phosphate glycosidase [Frankia sp. AgB1.8]
MPEIEVSAEVQEALAAGRAVVALESTLLAHGLPAPRNREFAAELEQLVRDQGAVPATVAVLDGVPTVGLGDAARERITDPAATVLKLSVRDLAPAIALGHTGATTVASTAWLAARAGIRVFATGGLGGVHRGGDGDGDQTGGGGGFSYDESADLPTLAATPITVVCAGVKSILDVGATLERLETLGVTVLGWQTSDFPGFYLPGTGHQLDWRVEDAGQVAAVMASADELDTPGAVIVAHPVAEGAALDRDLHDRVLADALAAASQAGLRGKAVTPFLLAAFHRETAGASLEVNLAVVRGNATVAAAIATAYASRRVA